MKVRPKLQCLNIFENLPQELLQKSVLLNRKKGEFLYHKGEKPKGIYFIKEGLIALTDISPNGSESLFRIFSKDFFIGYRTFIEGEEYHANAMALNDAKVFRLPFESIEELLNTYPSVLIHITKMLARDLRIAEERFNDITGKRVASRIIESLIFLKQRQPEYSWTRREIGEFSGAKTETVTRTFSTLEKMDLVTKQGRDIIIPNIEALIDYKEEMDLEG